MSVTVFAVEQIGIHSDSPVTNAQEEQLTGQRGKILTGISKCGNHVLAQQPTMVEFGELFRSHVLAHVHLGGNSICT